VAVQVSASPGARLTGPVGQVIAERVPDPEKFESVTVGSVSVTLPVLVTRNEYVTFSPTAAAVTSAVFFTVIPGVAGIVTVDDDGVDGTGVVDPGGVPSAVAVFVSVPASTSA
jgi:hypothetical protein